MDPYPDVAESCGSAVRPISKVQTNICFMNGYIFRDQKNFKATEVFLTARIAAAKVFPKNKKTECSVTCK
jgi:hypothetical protein